MPLTLPQAREDIRHLCGLLTALDVGMPNAALGDPNPSQPHPTNTVINLAIREAARTINQQAHFQGGAVIIPCPATVLQGSYGIDLQQPWPGAVRPEEVTYIRHARWTEDETNFVTLEASTFEALATRGIDWANMPPSSPRYYVNSYQTLSLIPGPQISGNLHLYTRLSVLVPNSDAEQFIQLPFDYQGVILDQAVVELAAMMPGDVEMQARGKARAAKAQAGIAQIVEWVNDNIEEFEPRFTFQSHRPFAGGRRR